jgi:D-glycero-D-manno-heptose 1,7-bisphosphate phosphatase
MKRAVFLDRDGVINRRAPEGDYIVRWEEMVFLPAVTEAIQLLNRAGFLVIVVTNQRCVAKGLITAEDLKTLHRKMCRELALSGARIDKVYYCPHDFEPHCSCRKPEPGMLLEAAREYEIALSESWMIGDSESDIEAGRRAGCKTARITREKPLSKNSDVLASSLYRAVFQILAQDETSTGLLGTGTTRAL